MPGRIHLKMLLVAIAWCIVLRLLLRLLLLVASRSRDCRSFHLRFLQRRPDKDSNCWLNLVRVPCPLTLQLDCHSQVNASLWSKLPSELLHDKILPRLPLLAVAKFRVVCRLWNRILSSPDLLFAAALRDQQSHRYWAFLESSDDDNERLSSLWIWSKLRALLGGFRNQSLFSLHCQPLDGLQPAKDCLLASSGGLLVLFDQARIIVSNPLLGIHHCYYRSRRMYRMFYGLLWCEQQQDYTVVEGFPTMLRGRVYHGRAATVHDFRIPDFACQAVGQGTECNSRLFWPSGDAKIVSCSPWLPEISWTQLDGPPQVSDIRCLFSWDNRQLYLLPQAEAGQHARVCWKMIEDNGPLLWKQVQVLDSHTQSADLEPVFMDTKRRGSVATISEHTDFLALDKSRRLFVWISSCKHEASSRIKQRWSLTSFQPSLTCLQRW